MSASHERPSWPMKWIVVAIILIIVPYTFLTLRYRKPGPAFQPYADIKHRANVSRLLEAGYQRISIQAQRPADNVPVSGGAAVATKSGGLPEELRSTLVELPLLPAELIDVTAAPVTSALQPYAIQFTCALPNEKQKLRGGDLYVRGDNIVIIPIIEPVSGRPENPTRQPVGRLTVPAGALKGGTYTVTLVGERSSRTWALEVR